MTFLIILQAIATLIMILSMVGVIRAYKIKITLNLILTSLIGLIAIIAAVKLATLSLPHFLIYGGLTAAFMVFLTTVGKAKPVSGMISCLLSFIFWPQFIAYTIFVILNAQ